MQTDDRLHLRVSVRSLTSAKYAEWVNAVISGDVVSAAAVGIHETFPVLLTRSLRDARALLRHHSLGESRCGLVGSSRAARLRADGLEGDSSFHGSYPWEHWYLASQRDVRSSNQLEVFATEFEIQGLELDWIGLCWGGDLIWSPARQQWQVRRLHYGTTTKWSPVTNATQVSFRMNAYRVLLTRARQGLVVYVPRGDAQDPTRDPADFDATADFLLACGAREV